MTHKRNFVIAIKVGGKVLRESGSEVELPFGSEYSLLMKNLDTVRVQAKVEIDGDDVSGWLVLQPNSSLELERFIRNGNLERGNRFKFIERTEAVEAGRGIKVEDGLIRVEFKREKIFEFPKVVEHHTYHHHQYWPPRPYPWPFTTYTWGNSTQSSSGDTIERGIVAMNNVNCSNGHLGKPLQRGTMMAAMSKSSDAGITVSGSQSDQKFVSVSNFQTDKSEVLVLKLVGRHGEAKVSVPVTVDKKPKCQTCKLTNKGGSKFCSRCGTSLQII